MEITPQCNCYITFANLLTGLILLADKDKIRDYEGRLEKRDRECKKKSILLQKILIIYLLV